MQTMPAELRELGGSEHTLLIVLDVAGHAREIAVEVSPHMLCGLRHLSALHCHQAPCPTAFDVAVPLLLRTIAELGAGPVSIIICDRPTPAFCLRVLTNGGPRELDLGVLDAFALLLSRQIPIEVVTSDDADWDAELLRLLDREG
ncbi:MAG: hypothetical protein ACRDYA_14595 [Egibacteraceae bacterium]